MVGTWMGDHSSVEVCAVVKNTAKISEVEIRGIQPNTPGAKKYYYLSSYAYIRLCASVNSQLCNVRKDIVTFYGQVNVSSKTICRSFVLK